MATPHQPGNAPTPPPLQARKPGTWPVRLTGWLDVRLRECDERLRACVIFSAKPCVLADSGTLPASVTFGETASRDRGWTLPPRELSPASVIFPDGSGRGRHKVGRLLLLFAAPPVTFSARARRSSRCSRINDRPGMGSTILPATSRQTQSPPSSLPWGRETATLRRDSCTECMLVLLLSFSSCSLLGLFARAATAAGTRVATRGTQDLGEGPGELDLFGAGCTLGARGALPLCGALRGREPRNGVVARCGVDANSGSSLGASTDSSARVQACSSSLLLTCTPVLLPRVFRTKPLLMISNPRTSPSRMRTTGFEPARAVVSQQSRWSL
mmetsp:Transcript_22445/g.52425  ORF Transcript_22445/g.52425 Transcript_22445/m.52425 type:complete len:328 (+) Transcript_22445:18-1001(+)